MRIYMIFILMTLISCKSTVEVKENKFPSDNFLLSLPINKNEIIGNKRITTYKNAPFKKELDIDSKSFSLYYEDEIVALGKKECLFLIEIFNNEVLVISISNNPKNKYVSGAEFFERDDVILIDINSGEKKMLRCEEKILLKAHKMDLNKFSTIKNVFAISKIEFSNNKVEFINNKDEFNTITLSKNFTLLECD